MKHFDQEILDFIRLNNLIGIKAGNQRETFLNIWMVVVNNRVFARSWAFSERSWYNTFMSSPGGQIQYGSSVVDIKAGIPEWNEELNNQINQAYLDKYDNGGNSFYARGIIKPEHILKTMEFMPS
jgi:hypothetical protein